LVRDSCALAAVAVRRRIPARAADRMDFIPGWQVLDPWHGGLSLV
jgi:hypothetical protein